MVKGYEYGVLGVEILTTISQADRIFQWIQLGITIVSALIILIEKIIKMCKKFKEDPLGTLKETSESLDKLQKWTDKSLEDGKISSEEIQELLHDNSKDNKESED